jgi:hypothetical protein
MLELVRMSDPLSIPDDKRAGTDRVSLFNAPERPLSFWTIVAIMKKYLLVRWKKRWPFILWCGFLVVLRTLTQRGTLLANVLCYSIFALLVILVPFHFWGENWSED